MVLFFSDWLKVISLQKTPVVSVGELSYLREKVHDVHVDGKIKAFIVDIVGTTRDNAWLYLGASPRASIALMNSAKAFAAISGRDFVVPEDVLYLAAPVLWWIRSFNN